MRTLLLVLTLSACDRPSLLRDGTETSTSKRPTLSVTVVDVAGAPVPGGWVTLAPSGRDRPVSGGTAAFVGVPPGAYTLIASDGSGAVGTAFVTVASDQSVEVQLAAAPEPPPALEGTVHGPDGAPLAGATVLLDDVPIATSGVDGRFAGGTPGAGTRRLEVLPPLTADDRVPWVHDALRMPADGTVSVDLTLAGAPPPTATTIGSGPCGACHAEIAARFGQTAHATSGREPADAAAEPLADAFTLGPTGVPLDDAGLVGASVTLGASGPGSWWVVVTDAFGASTPALPVRHVYGGHRAGAAVAVELDGAWRVAPAAWAADGAGLSTLQWPARWIGAWTDGWFDPDGHLAPTVDASFDLRCGGCHATGHALAAAGGDFALEPATSTGILERTVGCEACHGAGSDHRRNLDPGAILQPARLQAQRRIEVCARCHERTTADVHPFSVTPSWPVLPDGAALSPLDPVADHATPSPDWWLQAQSSRVLADQVGELRASPHRRGPDGWDGSCEDCHDPHGTANPADLRAADNTLCTSCHGSRFPTLDDEAAHAAHTRFEPGPWSPGGCTSCHLPRSGLVVRRDAVTFVGEDHGHQLEAWLPADALAEFDAVGVDQLEPADVPVGPCLDCHMNVDAERRDAGTSCPCPRGDLGSRVTYDNLGGIVDDLWGGP